MDPCLLLLAAGGARRMRGADKLLERVDGVPLLRLLCLRGLAVGLDLRATVPDLAHPRAKAVADLPVMCVAVPDWRSGMSASLRKGLADLRAPSVLILPADMPEITVADLRKIATHQGDIVQATGADGTPGHPVRFDARFFEDLRALSGDVGARSVLRANARAVVQVALPARHALTDLDTPENWSVWREARHIP